MYLLLASSTLDVKNGYGNITYELVSALVNRGHKVTLLLPETDKNFDHDISGVNIKRVLPPYTFSYRKFNALKYLTWKFEDSVKTNFDIVHSLFAFPYAPLMSREANRLKVPFIMGAQGTYGVLPLTRYPDRFFLKKAYASASAIHVPSDFTKNAIIKEAGISYNIRVIHNGVNYNRFANYEHKNAELIKKFAGKKVLLTVGELKNRKGQSLVIKALKFVAKQHPEVLYVMVGYPTAEASLKKLAAECGVSNNILITGAVGDTELLDYFYASDIYVHTPRISGGYAFEGFGIVYIEAGACGKTAVATDSGGVRDAVVDGKTGLIAQPENVEEIGQHICTLLSDDTKRKQFESEAKKYAEAHVWNKIVLEYETMYNDVLGKQKFHVKS